MTNVGARLELRLSGATGERACDWRAYALLRDNVQHYAEQGRPSERFFALHSLEKAVDGGALVVDAARLRGEVLRALSVLRGRSLQDAAISVRTRAKLTGGMVGSLRGTVRARLMGWEPALGGPAQASITSCASAFVSSVLALTGTAVDGDLLTVRVVEVGRDTEAPHATAAAPQRPAARAGPLAASTAT